MPRKKTAPGFACDTLDVDLRNDIALVALNRPELHNAFNETLIAELTAVLAAPGLLVAGAPLRSGRAVYIGAVAGSAILWMVVGAIAARRATRVPVASWRDYWREYVWLAAGVWLGVVVALAAVNLIFGRALF